MRTIYTISRVINVVAQRYFDPDAEGNIGYIDDDVMVGDEDVNQILEDNFDDEVLSGRMPETTVENAPPLSQVDLPEEEHPDFASSSEALNHAQQQNEAIRIYYTTLRGRDIIRDVRPQGQFTARTTHNLIVVTFDETVGGIRAFIVNNISYYVFLGENETEGE